MLAKEILNEYSAVYGLLENLHEAEQMLDKDPYCNPVIHPEDEAYWGYDYEKKASEQISPFAYTSEIEGKVGKLITLLQTVSGLLSEGEIKDGTDNQRHNISLEDQQKDEKVKLSEIEANIVESLGNEPLTGELIAEKAGYPYNSNFKNALSSLRKRGILVNKAPGYILESKYHYLLKQEDKSQD